MGHTVPQAPQLLLSDWRSVQVIPHMARGAAQGGTQAPATHVFIAGQAMPQAPQLATSVWVLTHVAIAPIPHATLPIGQVHTPAAQLWPMPH